MRASRGFTLFEVMAAVLILGIVYTVLADVAMDGLRSEGTNLRRGEASLLADRYLADLEAVLATGTSLTTERREEEVPPYRVTTEVTPFDVLGLIPSDPDAETTPAAPDDESSSLLTKEGSDESRIQLVTVTVEWDEAGQPYRVIRRTFALDTTGLEDLFPEEAAGGDSDLPEDLEQLGDQLPPDLRNQLGNALQ